MKLPNTDIRNLATAGTVRRTPSPTGSVRRIVLTGGPGAGKTVIARDIISRFPGRFVLVPEAATQVYAALQTRWDRLNLEGRRDVQRRIYRLQREQEDRILAAHPDRILLLDRGTIDGAAYWPEGPEAYWQNLATSHESELHRYDAVIWLQTSAALGLYDGDASNTCRFEDPAAAIESGELLTRLWGAHPSLHKVNACPHLSDKIAAVEHLLHSIGVPPMFS